MYIFWQLFINLILFKESTVCWNGGTCVNTPGSWYCLCPPGYTDSWCMTHIDQCKSNPCQNQGTCLDLGPTFKCICMSGGLVLSGFIWCIFHHVRSFYVTTKSLIFTLLKDLTAITVKWNVLKVLKEKIANVNNLLDVIHRIAWMVEFVSKVFVDARLVILVIDVNKNQIHVYLTVVRQTQYVFLQRME